MTCVPTRRIANSSKLKTVYGSIPRNPNLNLNPSLLYNSSHLSLKLLKTKINSLLLVEIITKRKLHPYHLKILSLTTLILPLTTLILLLTTIIIKTTTLIIKITTLMIKITTLIIKIKKL